MDWYCKGGEPSWYEILLEFGRLRGMRRIIRRDEESYLHRKEALEGVDSWRRIIGQTPSTCPT